jgi:hypothetical protein
MNRQHRLPAGSALVAIGLLLAACSSAAPTSAPSSGAVPTLGLPSVALPSLALPSLALPSLAVPSLGSFAFPSFSFPSEDKDLEASLPSQINGVTLLKYSFKGTSFLGSGGSSSQDLIDFVTSLGKSPNDLSIAFATDPTRTLKLQIGAFRVAGTDSGALLNAFIAATKKQSPDDTITPTSMGGKNVVQIVSPTDTVNGTVYVYAKGDVLFYVASPDPNLATAALQATP